MVMGLACFGDFILFRSFRPFRRFRSFRFGGFVSLFRVLVHALHQCRCLQTKRADTKTRNSETKPAETKRNSLAVSFHSGLVTVSFYLLVRAVLCIFLSFRFRGFTVSFRVLAHASKKCVTSSVFL